MTRKEKYKYLRQAGYKSKQASEFSNLGKEKFLNKLDKKGSKRIHNQAKKEIYKLSEKEKMKALEKNIVGSHNRRKAMKKKDKDFISVISNVNPMEGAKLSKKTGNLLAPTITKRKTKEEKSFKHKYVYRIEVTDTTGETKYISYGTDLSPSKINYDSLYNAVHYAIVNSYSIDTNLKGLASIKVVDVLVS